VLLLHPLVHFLIIFLLNLPDDVVHHLLFPQELLVCGEPGLVLLLHLLLQHILCLLHAFQSPRRFGVFQFAGRPHRFVQLLGLSLLLDLGFLFPVLDLCALHVTLLVDSGNEQLLAQGTQLRSLLSHTLHLLFLPQLCHLFPAQCIG